MASSRSRRVNHIHERDYGEHREQDDERPWPAPKAAGLDVQAGSCSVWVLRAPGWEAPVAPDVPQLDPDPVQVPIVTPIREVSQLRRYCAASVPASVELLLQNPSVPRPGSNGMQKPFWHSSVVQQKVVHTPGEPVHVSLPAQ